MNKRVKIEVIEVAGFGCSAKVKSRGRALYETRDYPFGQRANAYAEAESWASAHGYQIVGG